MNVIFTSPSWILSGIVIVIGSVLLAVLALRLIRKYISQESLARNHDLVKCCLGMLGALYSIILGFTVVNVQERYNLAFENVQTEAIALIDLYREAAIFNEDAKQDIRKNLRSYVDFVIHKEWLTLQNHTAHTQNHAVIANIWAAYYGVDVSDSKIQSWYQESISRLNDFLNARLHKYFSATHQLGSMMWTLLIFGGFINICLLLLFSFESARHQMLIVALPVAYLAFMLHMVHSLDNVFKGPQGIKPVAFEEALLIFDRWDSDDRQKTSL